MNDADSIYRILTKESFSHKLGQDARKYDFKDEIGRVESGTETENNACCHGWQVVEQCRSYCRGAEHAEKSFFDLLVGWALPTICGIKNLSSVDNAHPTKLKDLVFGAESMTCLLYTSDAADENNPV